MKQSAEDCRLAHSEKMKQASGKARMCLGGPACLQGFGARGISVFPDPSRGPMRKALRGVPFNRLDYTDGRLCSQDLKVPYNCLDNTGTIFTGVKLAGDFLWCGSLNPVRSL